MPKAVTVWAVRLGHGLMRELEGTLSLTSDELAFEAGDGYSHIRLPLTQLRSARRVRGSPVLLVAHQTPERTERIAFYFVQPPPLHREPDVSPDHRSVRSAAWWTRRKARRRNASYLGMWNMEKKSEVQEWADAIRSAKEGAER